MSRAISVTRYHPKSGKNPFVYMEFEPFAYLGPHQKGGLK